MPGFSLRLPEDLDLRLEEEARREGLARSEIARTAIMEFLDRRERQRYLAAFVSEAKAAYANPGIRRDAVVLAEESLPFDNEGLGIAESRGKYSVRPKANLRGKKR